MKSDDTFRGAADSDADDLEISAAGILLCFTLPGAFTGLAVHGLTELIEDELVFFPSVFAIVVLLVAPLVFWLSTGAGQAKRSAAFAALLGTGLAALVVWSLFRFDREVTGTQSYSWFAAAFAVFAITFLSVPFRQARITRIHDSDVGLYSRLFAQAWNQTATGLLAGTFSLASVLLVVVIVQLFSIVGIDLETTMLRPAVLLPIAAAAFASAIGIVRRKTTVLRATRTLLLALLRVLMPFMLAATAIFFVALAFLGLDAIETDVSVTAILLLSIALTLSLCSAWVGDTSRLEPRTPATLACRALALLVLPLALLAAWTLWLRIGTYGWTHDRLVASLLVAIAFTHGVGYAPAALSGARFARFLQASNIAAAALAIGLAVLYFTPLLDGHRIGASSQFARFSAPGADPTAAELGYLKFESGRHGKRALDKLAASPEAGEPPLADALAELARVENRYELRTMQRASLSVTHREKIEQQLDQRVASGTMRLAVPETEEAGEHLRIIESLVGKTGFERDCLEQAYRCVLLITSDSTITDSDTTALLVIDVPDGALELYWLRRPSGESTWVGAAARDVHRPTTDFLTVNAAVRDKFLEALAAGNLPTRPIERRAVVVGDRIFVPGEGIGTN